MKRTGPLRRFTAWLACFAVLLAALAPTVSHAIAASKGAAAGWGDICSVNRTAPAGSQDMPGAPQSGHFEHCPFCATHAGAAGLPPVQAPFLLLPAAAESPPRLFLQSSRPSFAWAIARSRAPPQPF